ncbi:MAG: hypothetical protein Q6353_014890 [Candidatus Sigynarchaeum springense]
MEGPPFRRINKGYLCLIDNVILPYLEIEDALRHGEDITRSMEYHIETELAVYIPEMAFQFWEQYGFLKKDMPLASMLLELLNSAGHSQYSQKVHAFGPLALLMSYNDMTETSFSYLVKNGKLPDYIDARTFQSEFARKYLIAWNAVRHVQHFLNDFIQNFEKVLLNGLNPADVAFFKDLPKGVLRALQKNLQSDLPIQFIPNKFIAHPQEWQQIFADGCLMKGRSEDKKEEDCIAIVHGTINNKKNRKRSVYWNIARLVLNSIERFGSVKLFILYILKDSGCEDLIGSSMLIDDISTKFFYRDVKVAVNIDNIIVEYKRTDISWDFIDAKKIDKTGNYRCGFTYEGKDCLIDDIDCAGGAIKLPLWILKLNTTYPILAAEIAAFLNVLNRMYNINVDAREFLDHDKNVYEQMFKELCVDVGHDILHITKKMLDTVLMQFGGEALNEKI